MSYFTKGKCITDNFLMTFHNLLSYKKGGKNTKWHHPMFYGSFDQWLMFICLPSVSELSNHIQVNVAPAFLADLKRSSGGFLTRIFCYKAVLDSRRKGSYVWTCYNHQIHFDLGCTLGFFFILDFFHDHNPYLYHVSAD